MTATSHSQASPPLAAPVVGRFVGFLFLAAILCYGIGNGLVESVLHAPDAITRAATDSVRLGIGALLMLTNSLIVVAIGLATAPVLRAHASGVADVYLMTRLAEGVLLAAGVAQLMSLTGLASSTTPTEAAAAAFTAHRTVVLKSQFYLYQTAMAALGAGSLVFCQALSKARLLPKILAVWGWMGYAVFLAGALLEFVGVPYSLLMCIPGGMFEIALGVWLLAKGWGAPVPVPVPVAGQSKAD